MAGPVLARANFYKNQKKKLTLDDKKKTTVHPHLYKWLAKLVVLLQFLQKNSNSEFCVKNRCSYVISEKMAKNDKGMSS